MMFKAISATTFFLLAMSIPIKTQADWMYSSWGSSLAQLIEAAKPYEGVTSVDDVVATPFGELAASAKHEDLGLEGIAFFAFKEGKLSAVLFTPAGFNQELLLTRLVGRYGAPIQRPAPGDFIKQTWLWRDEDNGNMVSYSHFPAALVQDQVTYMPIDANPAPRNRVQPVSEAISDN
ncbi:MAG: hypothetical protein CML68_20480 [Rhodobacteraceae bacterium]|nr:hypothetical protein [Paracoccaceae bacterium]